jgi:hypothetical protein
LSLLYRAGGFCQEQAQVSKPSLTDGKDRKGFLSDKQPMKKELYK